MCATWQFVTIIDNSALSLGVEFNYIIAVKIYGIYFGRNNIIIHGGGSLGTRHCCDANQKSYYIVKAFLGTFRAGFWQTFGRFFGVNMRDGFNPNSNKNDALLERICVRVEQGVL